MLTGSCLLWPTGWIFPRDGRSTPLSTSVTSEGTYGQKNSFGRSSHHLLSWWKGCWSMKSRVYYGTRERVLEDGILYSGKGTLWTRLPGSQRPLSIMLQKSWRNTYAESKNRRGRLGTERNEQHEGWLTEELRDQQTYIRMGNKDGDALNGG